MKDNFLIWLYNTLHSSIAYYMHDLLHIEVVDVPTLEGFKARLDETLSNLV